MHTSIPIVKRRSHRIYCKFHCFGSSFRWTKVC